LNFKQIEIQLLGRLSDLEFAVTEEIFITKSLTSSYVVFRMKHAYVVKILSGTNENRKIYGVDVVGS